MQDQEIEKLFSRVTRDAEGEVDEGVRRVFGTLVETTLKYRDELKERRGIMLTVDDVRMVLDRLQMLLTAGKTLASDNQVQADLLRRWLAALTANSAAASEP